MKVRNRNIYNLAMQYGATEKQAVTITHYSVIAHDNYYFNYEELTRFVEKHVKVLKEVS